MDAAFSFKYVKTVVGDHVLRNRLLRLTIDEKTVKALPAPTNEANGGDMKIVKDKKESVFRTMNKIAKGKLSLGAKIIQVGGVEKAFRRIFDMNGDEKLLRSFQCSLFTTAGPLSGRLFMSTEKLAFCSDKAIAKYSSSSGEVFRYYYKVVIPLRKVKKGNQIENVVKPSKKYLQVVTYDDFEFWFVGFLNYKRVVKCLNQALS